MMRRLLGTLALLGCVLCALPAGAACHAVTPSGAGSANGSSWSNAFAGIPATLTRGDTYYLSDGSYPDYTFNTATSGTTIIAIKKAQSYDFGRSSDGCSNDISTGWNASAMGSSQAVFNNASQPQIAVFGSYLTVDGNGTYSGAGCGNGPGANTFSSPATPSDCGIKLSAVASGTNYDIDSYDGTLTDTFSHITIRYVEIVGACTSGGGNGCNTADQNEIRTIDPGTSNDDFWTLTHIYGHAAGCVYVQFASNDWSATHNYWWGTEVNGAPTSGCHGQYSYFLNMQGGTEAYNVYRDITGTAVFTLGSGGTVNNVAFYGNVIWYDQTNPGYGGLSDAPLACINSSVCTNILYYHNSIVNCGQYGVFGPQCGVAFGDGASGNSVKIEDNLWYNSPDVGLTTNSTTVTEDYNSFVNSDNGLSSGAHDVHVASGAPNPLTNWPSSIFTLSSDNADWNGRLSLGSPYDTDAAGNAFTTDRGAYQYESGGGSINPGSSLKDGFGGVF